MWSPPVRNVSSSQSMDHSISPQIPESQYHWPHGPPVYLYIEHYSLVHVYIYMYILHVSVLCVECESVLRTVCKDMEWSRGGTM